MVLALKNIYCNQYKFAMKKVLLMLLLLPALTSCLNKHPNKKGSPGIFYPQEENTKIAIEYYDNKQIKRVTILGKDSSQSAVVGFDSSGGISFSGINVNNRRTHTIEYYPNGRPKGLVNVDSLGTGDAIYYYDNGNKKWEGRLQANLQIGIWKTFDQNGVLTRLDTVRPGE